MPFPSLTFPGQLEPTTKRELDALLAQVNEGFLHAEHNDDGTHGDVTADSITLNQGTTGDQTTGTITLYDEFGRPIVLDASGMGSESNQGLRVRVSDDLIAGDGSLSSGGTAAVLGVLQPTTGGNAFGPGVLLRKPATPSSPTDGWTLSVSETDALLSGTSMLAITNTNDGDIVLLLRPVGAAGSVTSYVLSPKAAYALGATVDLGRNATGERFQNIYTESLSVNSNVSIAGALTVTGDITSGDDITAADAMVAGGSMTAPFYIVGTPDTNGIRLFVNSGRFEVAEGDNSGRAPITASNIQLTEYLAVLNADPQIFLYESDQAVDNHYWRFLGNGSHLHLQPLNDATASTGESFVFTRQGRLLVGDGTFASPVFSFYNDSDTGLFRAGANQLGISAGGGTQALFTGGTGAYVFFGDGSVSNPLITFLNDTDTGLYRANPNVLAVTTGGALAAAFSAGQVLITDGSVLGPSLSFLNDTDSGLYRIGSNQWGLSGGSVLYAMVGPNGFYRADGAVGSPGFTFSSETTTGMYRSGTNEIAWSIEGEQRMRLVRTSSPQDATSLYVNAGAFSAGAVNGAAVRIGRNTFGAAGWVGMETTGGTEYAIWVDGTGDLRIGTAAPTANGGVSDTSGTVVGDQSSSKLAKNVLRERFDYQHALDTILNTPVFDFTYKSGRYNAEVFTGITTEESPTFGKDNGKAFNEVTAFGYLVNAVKAQQEQIAKLLAEVSALKAKLA